MTHRVRLVVFGSAPFDKRRNTRPIGLTEPWVGRLNVDIEGSVGLAAGEEDKDPREHVPEDDGRAHPPVPSKICWGMEVTTGVDIAGVLGLVGTLD